MRRERRQPTRREWEQITSPRPVIRRVLERRDSARPEAFESKPTNDTNTCLGGSGDRVNFAGTGLPT
jgi:hypothetical protein